MSTEGEEDRKGRKSYMLKIKELLRDMGRCEIYPMISGYTMGRCWEGDKEVYIIHGNSGRVLWFMRFLAISKTGRIWGLNEQGMHLKSQ